MAGRPLRPWARRTPKAPRSLLSPAKSSGAAWWRFPWGNSLKDVIFDIAGGIKDGRAYKAVQMGGPSGGCIPAALMDTPIDYKALSATGAIMGSGGMVVMDDSTCMVNIARFFLDFTARESCGKCVPCRIGTTRMMEILNRICEGEGQEGDIELLEELCVSIKDGALCGLGQTAPNPVLTTIRYFREEYEAHIRDKKCPAHECSALLTISIEPGQMYRLHCLRPEVPGGVHQRDPERAPCH